MRSQAKIDQRRQSYHIHCSHSQGPSLSAKEGIKPMRRYLQGLQREASDRLGSSINDIQIDDDNASMVPDSSAHSFSCLDHDPDHLLSYDAHGDSETSLDVSFREERWETPEHHHQVSQAQSGAITSRATSESACQQKQRSPPPVPQRQASL
jgi:hypothetical protein